MKGFNDLIIFGLGYLEGCGNDKFHSKQKMAEVLGITESTMNRYLKDLCGADIVKKTKDPENGHHYELTDTGKKKYKSLLDTFKDMYLTPEQHDVGRVIPLGPYLEFKENRHIGFKIIANTYLQKKFDVSQAFQRDAIQREDSRYLAQIKEGLSVEEDIPSCSLDDMIKANTRLGIKPGIDWEHMMDRDRTWSNLSEAEYMMRTGSLDEAMVLYRHLLVAKKGLHPNAWIVAYTRYLKCLMWKGDHDRMNHSIDWIRSRVKNCVHRAMILEIKAISLSMNEHLDEASSIYNYCLGVYNSKNHPILRASAMNNAAVNFFRQEKYDLAEEMWKKAGRESRARGLFWLEAIVCINMGDNLSFHRGQVKRGKDLVRRGRRIMEGLKDQEGIADAYFNEALICIEEGNSRLADKHFLRSMDFPIQDRVRRDERIKVYKDRLERRGMEFSILLK